MANTIDFGNKTIKNAALDPASVVGVGIPDSASDGGVYARKDAEWVPAAAATPLQFRSGLDSERQQITPANGELIYATDTKLLYIGDGTTVGGNLVSAPPDFLSQIPGNPPGMIKGTTIKSSSTFNFTVRSQTGYATVMWWDGTITIAGTGGDSLDINFTSPSIPLSGAYARSAPKTFYVWPSTSTGVQSGWLSENSTPPLWKPPNLTRFSADNTNSSSLVELHVKNLASLGFLNLSCATNSPGLITSINLTGVGLATLLISNQSLFALDVSGMTSLLQLNCSGNCLTSLDVSGCTAMHTLNCNDNSLTSLDASGLTALTTLSCGGNELWSLNVAGCTALATLFCNNNSLASLDVSECTMLHDLFCDNNSLASLNVSGCSELNQLGCYNNSLASLDVSDCTSMTELNCNNNSLVSLNLGALTALQYFICHNNSLASLDVSGFTDLVELNCSNNSIISLNASGLTSLTTLKCNNNSLASLDVSGCTALTTLWCGENALTSLDVSLAEPTSLYSLICRDNSLTSLRAQNRYLSGGYYYGTYGYSGPPGGVYGGINARNNSLNAAALNQLYTDLGSGSGPIVVTNNSGTADDDPTIATGKGYTVYGS